MFYILDCNSKLVGNPKGYRTMRGAIIQADSRKSKVHKELWYTHDNWFLKDPNLYLVYSITSNKG